MVAAAVLLALAVVVDDADGCSVSGVVVAGCDGGCGMVNIPPGVDTLFSSRSVLLPVPPLPLLPPLPALARTARGSCGVDMSHNMKNTNTTTTRLKAADPTDAKLLCPLDDRWYLRLLLLVSSRLPSSCRVGKIVDDD